VEKKPEARRQIGFKESDFNKAVTEVHQKAIVRSAFNFPTVMRMSAKKMSMAVTIAANVLNHIVKSESHQSPARNLRKPAASLGA
jgi:hypothetical protein